MKVEFYRFTALYPGSILNARSGETGLHLAAKSGRPEALRVLLKLGADPIAKGIKVFITLM